MSGRPVAGIGLCRNDQLIKAGHRDNNFYGRPRIMCAMAIYPISGVGPRTD